MDNTICIVKIGYKKACNSLLKLILFCELNKLSFKSNLRVFILVTIQSNQVIPFGKFFPAIFWQSSDPFYSYMVLLETSDLLVLFIFICDYYDLGSSIGTFYLAIYGINSCCGLLSDYYLRNTL